ncbi:hypothetical protein N5C96_07510 [Delftia tsuruhatensis]|uniref:hypothetical protein n=1 Tax=Delftia tsuruhatensis TaxID=180282 RepID=UPI002260BF5C|nr:hypothetical protein [Delftia tsuruhatensis]MCX7509492.1 hypothetical protein [Delftia tsuruhatensis]MDH0773240.1 hypothetical protein [Delftia tsuruhatensis]MDH1462104.1 hypothetical protein [Delftia tsuruhatensis]MDH1826756.1 hypothetical protein [Delftia tsuruhatensis]WGG13300.1 hypothetical protein N5O86_11940 [Delftia tsuruhatensis]
MKIKLTAIIIISIILIWYFFKKDDFSYYINRDYDFVCIFPPYTPKLFIIEDLKKYSNNIKDNMKYKESMDDGIFTYFFIKNKEIISSGEEMVINNSMGKYGCFGK